MEQGKMTRRSQFLISTLDLMRRVFCGSRVSGMKLSPNFSPKMKYQRDSQKSTGN